MGSFNAGVIVLRKSRSRPAGRQ